MLVKYSLGIDISSETFDSNLSVIDSEQNVKVIASHKFANNQNGFAECHKWITKNWKQKDIRLVVTISTFLDRVSVGYCAPTLWIRQSYKALSENKIYLSKGLT